MDHSKGGRPRRWDPATTKTVKAKLPQPLADALNAEAARNGMTMQDFIGHVAERLTGVPYNDQEQAMAS